MISHNHNKPAITRAEKLFDDIFKSGSKHYGGDASVNDGDRTIVYGGHKSVDANMRSALRRLPTNEMNGRTDNMRNNGDGYERTGDSHDDDSCYVPKTKTSRKAKEKTLAKTNGKTASKVHFLIKTPPSHSSHHNDNKPARTVRAKPKPKSKCTPAAVLEAFKADPNMPNFDEIAQHELNIVPVNAGFDRVFHTPSQEPDIHKLMEPFNDLIDWNKVDWDKEDPNIVASLVKNREDRERKTRRSKSNEQVSRDLLKSQEVTVNENQLPEHDIIDHEDCPTPCSSWSLRPTSVRTQARSLVVSEESTLTERPINKTLYLGKERLRSAGLGHERLASTPQGRKQIRHRSIILEEGAKVSPIIACDSDSLNVTNNQTISSFKSSDDNVFSSPNDTTLMPPPKIMIVKTRKVPKASMPIYPHSISLELASPQDESINKSKYQSRVSNLYEVNEVEQEENVSEGSGTLVGQQLEAKQPSASTYSRTRLGARKRHELSHSFAPRIKSTPLESSINCKSKSNYASRHHHLNNTSIVHSGSHFDLYVDNSRLQTSMQRFLVPKRKDTTWASFSTNHSQNQINDSRVASQSNIQASMLLNNSNSVDKSNKGASRKQQKTPYQVYRKSIASVSCQYESRSLPKRSIVRIENTLLNETSNTVNNRVAQGLSVKDDLSKYFNLTVALSQSRLITTDGLCEEDLTSKDKVLAICGQEDIVDFKHIFPDHVLENIKKLGEGSYGEVFASKDGQGKEFVIKILSLNMEKLKVDEEGQYAVLLPELVIANSFNILRKSKTNKACNFIELSKTWCARGMYPERLQQEWDLFKKRRPKECENDSPSEYKEDQVHIIMELSNGGTDLEKKKFSNAMQSLSVLTQCAFSLAVAECEFEFEHRDLHWGNVLIAQTTEDRIKYIVDGVDHSIASHNVIVSIIDFSLSRMVKEDYVVYDDLSKYEDIFTGTGDYQFDVYRQMRAHNKDNWQKFCPYTNLLWLHYLLDKLLTKKKYDRVAQDKKKAHDEAIKTMQLLQKNILNYKSASHLVRSKLFSNICGHEL